LKRHIRNPCLTRFFYRQIKLDSELFRKHKTTLLGDGEWRERKKQQLQDSYLVIPM